MTMTSKQRTEGVLAAVYAATEEYPWLEYSLSQGRYTGNGSEYLITSVDDRQGWVLVIDDSPSQRKVRSIEVLSGDDGADASPFVSTARINLSSEWDSGDTDADEDTVNALIDTLAETIGEALSDLGLDEGVLDNGDSVAAYAVADAVQRFRLLTDTGVRAVDVSKKAHFASLSDAQSQGIVFSTVVEVSSAEGKEVYPHIGFGTVEGKPSVVNVYMAGFSPQFPDFESSSVELGSDVSAYDVLTAASGSGADWGGYEQRRLSDVVLRVLFGALELAERDAAEHFAHMRSREDHGISVELRRELLRALRAIAADADDNQDDGGIHEVFVSQSPMFPQEGDSTELTYEVYDHMAPEDKLLSVSVEPGLLNFTVFGADGESTQFPMTVGEEELAETGTLARRILAAYFLGISTLA